MGNSIQEELYKSGYATKEQRDQGVAHVERQQRIEANNARHRDRVETIANSLGLNQEFVNQFIKRSDRKMTILKELGKSKQGKSPKCTVCKKIGLHYPASDGRENPKTVAELYKFFNLCTGCFSSDTYHARLGMIPAKKRDHHDKYV